MPTSMSQENIFSLSKGLWHTWHWVSSGGGLPVGLWGQGMGAEGAEVWCLRKWDWTELNELCACSRGGIGPCFVVFAEEFRE